MQTNGKYSWAKHIDFMLVDLGSLLLSFVTAFFPKFGSLDINEDWIKFAAIISLLNIVISLVLTPYSGIFRRRFYQEIGRAFILVVCNALCISLFLFVFKIGATYSREVVIYTYLFYLILSLVFKYIWKLLIVKGRLPVSAARKISLFVICYADEAAEIVHNAQASDLDIYDIKGIHLIDRGLDGVQAAGEIYGADGRRICTVSEDHVEFILENGIDEVMVAADPGVLSSEDYRRLVSNGVGVDLVAESALGLQTEEQYITSIGIYKALSVGSFSFTPAQSFYLLIKRVMDIICSIVGMVFLIPVAVIVKLSFLFSGDTARIFYRQERVGLNGKKIRIWKFRTMVPEAEAMLGDMLKEEKWRKQWEENQKLYNDPRITKAGRFLRHASLDELPQVINVFLGEMSFVGPRPLVEGELETHGGLKIYQRIKPGITGWWACNGRSNIDYRERLELEYYYIRNCSFSLDILCVFRTILAIMKRDGAR